MAAPFSKKPKPAGKTKPIVREWNLAARLDPKSMKEEGKKKGFSKLGNKR